MKTGKMKTTFGKYALALTTLMVLGFLIAFYFLFYVAKQDREITKRNFRALNRATVNINNRLVDFVKLYSSAWNNHGDKVCDKSESTLSLKAAVIKELGKKIDDVVAEDDSVNVNHLNGNIILDEQGENTFISFEFNCNEHSKFIYKLQISLKNFLKPLLPGDLFNNFLIIRDSNVIFKDFPQGIMMNKFDSLFEKNSILKTSSVQKLKFSGENYTLFVVPFYFDGKSKCALVGIIPAARFDNEKYAVPQGFLLSVIFILLFIFISFPFIKTLLMNSNERLRTLDILLSFFAFFTGTGIIIFILLQFYTQNKDYLYMHDQSLEALSDSIRNSFVNDLKAAYNQLSVYDSMVVDNHYDIVNIKKDAGEIIHNGERRNLKPVYPYFKLAFWMDKGGFDSFQWTTEEIRDVRTSYSDRPYYKNIRDSATWRLPDNNNFRPFTLQPIYSWTDGQFKAIVAKSSLFKQKGEKDSIPYVAALSVRLPSVINPILPMGYSFCIINQAGDVQFHSDRKKSLNENFLEECNNSSLITSAINARSSAFFEQYYGAENRAMYICPIQDLPLFIVTMRNNAFIGTANFEIFTFTSTLLFLNVVFIVLIFFGLVSIQRRQTKLKSNLMQMEWMWPVDNKALLYTKLIILNIVMGTMIMVFSTSDRPLLTVLLVFSNSLFVTAAYFYTNALLLDRQTKIKKSTWLILFIVAIDFLILTLSVRYLNRESNILLILYQVILIAVIYFLFHKVVLFKVFAHKRLQKFKLVYKESYVLVLMTWIILSSVIPVYLLYKISYNHEMETLVKQNQLFITQRINRLTDNSSPDAYKFFEIVDNSQLHIRNCYTSILNNTTVRGSISPEDSTGLKRSGEYAYFSYLIKKFKVLFNTISKEQVQLDESFSIDSTTYKWKRISKDEYLFRMKDVLLSRNNIGDSLMINSEVPSFPIPIISSAVSGLRCLNLWFPLILFFALLFALIRFFVGKLFITNYFTIRSAQSLRTEPNFFPAKRSIVVSLPKSGKSEFFKNEKEYNDLQRIDFTLAGNETSWQTEKKKVEPFERGSGVLITHFEYNLGDRATNDRKRAFIELLLAKKVSTIILVSTIHPEAFLLNLRVDKANADFTQFVTETNYYQWVSIFSSFELCYFPLSISAAKTEEIKSLVQLIQNEGIYGTYLPAVRDKLIAFINEHKPRLDFNHEVQEEMILKFQNMSYPYYLSIWNSLSREEQYLLYDLAEDGLTNYKSRDIITTLYNKGLIVNNHQLPAIMNQSFKNFILTEVKSGSAIINDKIRSEGSLWSSFKMPFYIVIAVVVLFIFYTQQESFNKMTTLITAFATLLPLVLRLFTNISDSKTELPSNPAKPT